jgi:hypothetical protein
VKSSVKINKTCNITSISGQNNIRLYAARAKMR